MNIPENYYSILNIDRKASNEEIKKSYRKLAMKYHPDKCPDGSERFKKIAEAYSILSDTAKKAQYDICGFSDINIGDPMEIFTQIFSDFKPDVFANLSDNIMNNFSGGNPETKVFIKTFVSDSNFGNKINEALPDMLNTFQNVITGNEDNSLKTGLMKTFLSGAFSSFNTDTDDILDDYNETPYDTDSDRYEDMSLNKEDILKNEFKNEFKEHIYTDIYTDICMKPPDIVIKKKYPLKEFYLNKNKRIKFIKTDIIDNEDKRISEIIKVPVFLDKEIKFKGMGHKKKNFKGTGDITFIFSCIENDLFKIHDYHLIYSKEISICDLYGKFMFTLTLPNDNSIEIICNDLYKTDLILVKEQLGLPIPYENTRSDLFIKFKVIYPDLNDENIKDLKKIFL